jgi:transcriptional regulator with PAS, ATPase and Fis domain
MPGREIITEDERFLTILGNLLYVRDNTHINILISGETGVGKELIARYIHGLGNQSRPFVVVNCATISDTLAESELFGHTKGSFTGATHDRIGKFELAHGGDIFLDEIGTLTHEMQTRFLRVLQEKEVERVGSHNLRKIDCRVIAATNEDLEGLVEAKRFRLDLYHRLKGVEFTIPPLRVRPHDIDLLIDYFIRGSNLNIPEEVRKILRLYSWPGNVRELENYMKRMVAMKKEGFLSLRDIPHEFYEDTLSDNFTNASDERNLLEKAKACGLKSVLEEVEKTIITEALQQSKDQASCAELLQTSAATITRKIKDYGLK